MSGAAELSEVVARVEPWGMNAELPLPPVRKIIQALRHRVRFAVGYGIAPE